MEEENNILNNVTEKCKINVVVVPHTKATGNVTNDISGDEDLTSVSNLPALQLRAAAKVFENLSENTQNDSNILDDNNNMIIITTTWVQVTGIKKNKISLHFIRHLKKSLIRK